MYIVGYEKFINRRDEMSDDKIFRSVFEKMLSYQDIDIINEINEYLYDTDLLNEGFFDKLKERFPKASKVSKSLSERGEKILKKILDGAKNAVSFVKTILKGLKDLISKYFKSSKDWVYKFLTGKNSDEIKTKIKELNSENSNGLKYDIKTGRTVAKWYKDNFLSKILSNTENNMTDFVSNDQEPIAESLNEGKNVISTLIHGIEKIPPFSWLHKLAKSGEAGANALIEVMSKLTKKLGGPSFKLPVISALIGIMLEQFIKTDIGHWLLDLVGNASGIGLAIKGIKYVALVVAVIIAIDELFGEKILGSSSDKPSEDEEEDI